MTCIDRKLVASRVLLTKILCPALLSVQAALLLFLGWSMSATPTEVGHVGAAVYWWRAFSNDVFCVNPPLTRVVAGLPIALLQPDYDGSGYSSHPYDRPEWNMGRAFLDQNPPTTKRWCVTLARWSLIPFVLLGGYFGYRLAGDMYGQPSAIAFLCFWTFSPLLLGWGATMCPDATAASLGIVALYMFRQWLITPTWPRALSAGACFGLLLLSKLTWVIALAIGPLLWLLWRISLRRSPIVAEQLPQPLDQPPSQKPPFKQLCAIGCVGLYLLNCGYLFEGSLLPLGEYEFVSQTLSGKPPAAPGQKLVIGNRFTGTLLGMLPVPLPKAYVEGADIQRHDFEEGKWSYLRGEWQSTGWWYFYLYALAIKTPLGFWLLCLVAIALTLSPGRSRAGWRDDMLLIVPLVAVVAFVSCQTGFSAHPRYVLPALPFLFVFASKSAQVFQAAKPSVKLLVAQAFVALALTWTVASSLLAYPHCLSYCNELVGGPAGGPKHLLGSSNDWGQDLFYLEDWYHRHEDARPFYVAYQGGYRLRDTTIESPGRPPGLSPSQPPSQQAHYLKGSLLPGWYALSVNEIYGRGTGYAYFQSLEPAEMAGYSIYIYHVTSNDVTRLVEQIDPPAAAQP